MNRKRHSYGMKRPIIFILSSLSVLVLNNWFSNELNILMRESTLLFPDVKQGTPLSGGGIRLQADEKNDENNDNIYKELSNSTAEADGDVVNRISKSVTINAGPKEVNLPPGNKGETECVSFKDEPEMEAEFRKKCSFFFDDLKYWQHSAENKKSKIVSWQQQSGAGDRLAGMISMFYYGFTTKKKMTLRWRLLDSVFKPSCFMEKILSFSNAPGQKPEEESVPCMKPSCTAALKEEDVCENADMHLVDKLISIRACASMQTCSKIDEYYNNRATLAEIIGCPLRLMMDYKDSFLDSKVMYFLDGKSHSSTLRNLGKVMRQYKIVALHYRAGDSEMTSGSQLDVSTGILSSATDCVKSVSDFLNSKTKNGDTRPVKWLVASDSENIRAFYRHEYPKDVIQLLIHPEHISKTKVDDPVHKIVGIFQEFYLLSLADELVSTYREKRLSAYSKFARLMNLKSRVYITDFRGRNCVYKEMDYEGNTHLFPLECSANPYLGHYALVKNPNTGKRRKKHLLGKKLPQNHIANRL